MRLLYTLGIYFYTIGIHVAALFGHRAAKQIVLGRRMPMPKSCAQRSVWFHASSLGEFEQARPVLEKLRECHPEWRIVVSFFSPSGYEVRKNYPNADAVVYLPADTPWQVAHFIDWVNPQVAFFVKYDFWWNTLQQLHLRGIPVYLFSAIFRPNQYFFKPWGRWFRRELGHSFTHIFVQNEESLALLRSVGIEHCSLAGDTRFDRVHQITISAEADPVVEEWLSSEKRSPVLVCGSTWMPDEEILCQATKGKDVRLIIAPHHIEEDHLRQIERLFPDSSRHSEPHKSKVLIVDCIGILSRLYRYASIAYIGGGFGAGIHNTLEAAAFAKPILFGPRYEKFQEAHDLLRLGAAQCHTNACQLSDNIDFWLSDTDRYNHSAKAAEQYINSALGSTQKILSSTMLCSATDC